MEPVRDFIVSRDDPWGRPVNPREADEIEPGSRWRCASPTIPLVPLLATLAAGLLDLISRSLPPRALMALAAGAGGLWWRLSAERQQVVDENLRIALGDDLDATARREIGRAACQGLARVVAEIALADRLFGSGRGAAQKMAFYGEWEALEADRAAGRGGVIVTAHLGNWEIGAFGVRHRGIPLRAMARPLRSAALEAWLERRRGGAERMIRKTGGLKDVLRELKAGGWVALLADQNAGRHGLFLPFFGLEASTFPTPAAVGERLGVPVYLGICLRRPDGVGFDIHLERVPTAEGVEAATRDLNRRLEGWIRRAPGQYNWVHRRWKTRPPGRDRSEPGQPSYARLWPANHPKTGVR